MLSGSNESGRVLVWEFWFSVPHLVNGCWQVKPCTGTVWNLREENMPLYFDLEVHSIVAVGIGIEVVLCPCAMLALHSKYLAKTMISGGVATRGGSLAQRKKVTGPWQAPCFARKVCLSGWLGQKENESGILNMKGILNSWKVCKVAHLQWGPNIDAKSTRDLKIISNFCYLES